MDTAPPDFLAIPPIAVCSVSENPVAPPNKTAHFDGSASFSPDYAVIVGEEWSITMAPAGNGAALTNRTGWGTSLTPQLAGEYRVELSVIDERGLRSEEPCVIVLQANPMSNLYVEMFWSHQNDDMDLHVVRPGGTARTFDDCFAVTCIDGIDWGVPGDPSDDVFMMAADADGVGPELIEVDTNNDGEFQVFVHDNPASVRIDPTNVTVNIVLDGEVVFGETRPITGEDTDTLFATVNPVTGIVTPAP
jgi:hypothetical protein